MRVKVKNIRKKSQFKKIKQYNYERRSKFYENIFNAMRIVLKVRENKNFNEN